MKRENDVGFTKANQQVCGITQIPGVTVETYVFGKPDKCLKFGKIMFFGGRQGMAYCRHLIFEQANGVV